MLLLACDLAGGWCSTYCRERCSVRPSVKRIADALLTYQRNEPDCGASFHYRFIELDRATIPVDTVAAKLARYAGLYRHTGAARRRDDHLPRRQRPHGRHGT